MEPISSLRLEFLKETWPEVFKLYKKPIWNTLRTVSGVLFGVLAVPLIASYLVNAYQQVQFASTLTFENFIDLMKIILFSYFFCSFFQRALLKRHANILTGNPLKFIDGTHDLKMLSRFEGWSIGIGLPLIVIVLLYSGELKRISADSSQLQYQLLFGISIVYVAFQLFIIGYSILKLK